MTRKIGISTYTLQSIYGNEYVFEIAKKLGADCVDFNLVSDEFDCETPGSVYSKTDDEIIEYFERKSNEKVISLKDNLINLLNGRFTNAY